MKTRPAPVGAGRSFAVQIATPRFVGPHIFPALHRAMKSEPTSALLAKIASRATEQLPHVELFSRAPTSRMFVDSLYVGVDGGVERHLPVINPNPTERLERGELRQRIDRALNQLSYEHRTVLILHEFEELEYKMIAKKMNCSIGTVMSRLFYARRKMASLLASLKREELR